VVRISLPNAVTDHVSGKLTRALPSKVSVTVIHPKQVDFGTTDHHDRASVTVSGKRKGNVKVALNSNQVKSLQAGVHADGGGLYLVVRESGDRVWAFRFTDLEGKRAQMEFARAGDRDGASGDVLTLSSAREKARDYKVALKREGIDPRVKKRATAQGSKTFKEFAEEQYPDWCQGLSEEELKQWQRSIRDVPSLHDKKLQEITTEHVLEALKAIWTVKPVTASRTRQRIERLMDAAKALRLRTGENPAAWRGNLKHLLPSPRKLNRKKGHRSAPYTKMPGMMTGLRYDLRQRRPLHRGRHPHRVAEPRNPADGVDGARLRSKDVDGSG
jgi:hypothetical protein